MACIGLALAGCGGGSHTNKSTTATAVTATSTSVPTPTATTSAGPRSNLGSTFEDEALIDVNSQTAMSTFKALGVQTVRLFVFWGYMAPNATAATTPKVDLTDPDVYAANQWAIIDGAVRAAQADRIHVLLDVGAPAPTWAEGKDPKGTTGGWKPNPTDYEDFMEALGKRYSGTYTPSGQSSPLPRVSDWSVWNEPNYIYLLPNAVGSKETPYSPRLYRGLVDAAFSGLAKTGHTSTSDSILIGETAPRGLTGPGEPGLGGGLVPLTFIRALYCVSDSLKPLTGSAATTVGCPSSGSTSAFTAANPGLFDAAGFADHPYADTTAPTVKEPDSANYTDFASLGNLEATLDAIFTAYGSHRQIPIYNTEYGYKTNPPTSLGVPDKTAAAYDNETEYLSWLNPRIRSYSQYLLADPAASTGNDFDTGIESPTASTPTTGLGTPKPDVYDAYRMPLWLPRTAASKGQKLEVWGCARPVNDEGVSAATVNIQFAAGSSSSYTTAKTVTIHPKLGGCYFTSEVAFPRSGTVRLSFRYGSSTIVSRTQTITIH